MHSKLSLVFLYTVFFFIDVDILLVFRDRIEEDNAETEFLYGNANDDLMNDICSFYDFTSDGNCAGYTFMIDDKELRKFSGELFKKDSHELYKYVTINYQGHTTSRNSTDEAPLPLLSVSPKALASPIPKLMQRLYNNYELDTRKEEHVTTEENMEEDDLIDAILATDVMASTMDFLSNKGFFNKDFEEFKKTLKNIWFSVFAREKGKYGSSGFEHIFLVEKKRGRSIGLHNWIFFHTEELAKKLNYFGYLRNLDINGKAAVAMLRFTYNGKIKSSSMFIGTSPELEMALYTLCFFARPNRYCRLSLNEKKLGIQTYVWNDRNKELIAAAFPMI